VTKEIGSHLNSNGERVYDGDNPFQAVPHQHGNCASMSDHHLVKVGTVELGGVEFDKVECRKPNCTYTGTRPR
jgi:hypothetical protein